MEIQKITYDTKKYIRNDPNYPKTQTITDEDMNEIKSVVNNNAYKQDEDYLKLKNVALNAETEESKSLYVTDANKFGQLEVLGNQEQETSLYNGNLEQGSISESGPVDASNRIRTAEYIEVKENTEINVSADGANEYILVFYNSNKEYIQSSLWANLGTDTAIIANSQFVKVLLRKTDNSSITVSNVSDFIVGSTPSPDYPSEVKCLGSNKQLFDKDNANKINATPSGLVIIAGSSGAKSFYLEVKPNTDYTISRKIVGKRFLAATSVEVPVVGTSLTQNIINNDGDEINIKTGANDKYLLVYYLYNNSENEEEILSNIKVEEGTEATSYSPYGQGSTLISKINRNVLEKPENSTSSGVGITVNYENGKYIINGMTTEGCYLKLNKELLANTFAQSSNWQKSKLKPGEYVFSIKTISGNTNSENINIFLRNATSNAVFNQEIDKVSKPGSLSKSFLTEEEQDYFCYLWMPGSTTFTNFTFSVMLEKGTELTELTENQQTDYILYIQQEMLQGDYFIKEADGWKEVHNYPKINSDNFNNITENTAYSGLFMLTVEDLYRNDIKTSVFSDYYKAVTPGYMNSNLQTTEYNISAFTNNRIFITHNDFANNLSGLKNFLIDNNVSIFAKTTTPTKLACTPEQSAVLEELNNLDLFEGVNNIITEEDIALLKLKYALDVKTYVNNQLVNVNAQILNIAGGN